MDDDLVEFGALDKSNISMRLTKQDPRLSLDLETVMKPDVSQETLIIK